MAMRKLYFGSNANGFESSILDEANRIQEVVPLQGGWRWAGITGNILSVIGGRQYFAFPNNSGMVLNTPITRIDTKEG